MKITQIILMIPVILLLSQCQEPRASSIQKILPLLLVNSYDFQSTDILRVQIGEQTLFEQPLNSLDGHAKRFDIAIQIDNIAEVTIYLADQIVAKQAIDFTTCDCLYIDVWGKAGEEPANAVINPSPGGCPLTM